MEKRPLGATGLSVSPIVFGGNVFGWTLDEKSSFAILDAMVERGITTIDTADVYARWVPGNTGGESETIIGRWLKARPGLRDRLVIFTKGGSDRIQEGKKGLSAEWLTQAVDQSLARLGIDCADVYFSHRFDPLVPQEETLGVYEKLMQAGKIRAIGASNFSAGQLSASQDVASANSLPAYQVIQPEYNLYHREGFDGPLRDLCMARGIAAVNYYSLAAGFLTGKFRSEQDLGAASRGGDRYRRYLNPRGMAILAALDQVGAAHAATPAEVALAWLLARPGVTAPIASATTVAQLDSFVRATALRLTPEEIARLDQASA